MARVLGVTERTIEQAAHARYVAELVERKRRAALATANFWVFEDVASPGRFLEFVEAGSMEVLETGMVETRAKVDGLALPPRVWREVTGT